jgi:flagellar hook-basal body complex protein FliE
MPVDPAFLTQGAEWQVPGVGPLEPQQAQQPQQVGAPEGQQDFGGVLAGQIDQLAKTQQEGGTAAQSLAEGTASDVSSVVTAVERARLSMQLASQVRNKAVEAYQEIFRTQV